MHERKCSTGKVCGIVFFILTMLVLVFCSSFSIYFSGQQKVIDKFYNAIEQQDSDMFAECMSEKYGQSDYSDIVKTQYNALSEKYTEDFNVLNEFEKREKGPDGGYDYYVKVTFYNDDTHQSFDNVAFYLVHENGRWIISQYQSVY